MENKAAIIRYCKYQERCHSEVKNKLYELGCSSAEVDELLTEMIEIGLLNEERFARAFARGRFRLKQWGRDKIKYELRIKKVSDYCIKKALTEIDPEEYDNTINKLMDKKMKELKGERSKATFKAKVSRYLLQKGYERDIVFDLLHYKLNSNGEA